MVTRPYHPRFQSVRIGRTSHSSRDSEIDTGHLTMMMMNLPPSLFRSSLITTDESILDGRAYPFRLDIIKSLYFRITKRYGDLLHMLNIICNNVP